MNRIIATTYGGCGSGKGVDAGLQGQAAGQRGTRAWLVAADRRHPHPFASALHHSTDLICMGSAGAFSASGKPASFRFRCSLIPAGLSRDSLQSSLPLRRPGAVSGVSLESGNRGKLLLLASTARDALLAVGGYLREGVRNHAAQRGHPAAKTAASWLRGTPHETPPPSQAGGVCLFSGDLKVSVVSNHPNRGWRGRWVVDVENGTATHRDGWVFKFDRVVLNGESVLSYDCIQRPVGLVNAKFERVAQEALDIYRFALQQYEEGNR